MRNSTLKPIFSTLLLFFAMISMSNNSFAIHHTHSFLKTEIDDSTKYNQQKEVRESAELWKNEPFAYQDLSKEIIGKRDANAKHFQKADGSISAHIAAGDIHYKENNEWKTIYHTISPTSNGFENVHNSHKTYYPATATGSLKTVLKNGKEMRDMIDMNMYFTVNGNKVQVQNIQNTNGNANFNKLTYPNVYGNGIDLELTQETSVRKLDYVIHNLQALGNIPNNATHVVFEETVELPVGWTAEIVDNRIMLKNANGEVQAFYDKPFLEDAPKLYKQEAAENENDKKNIEEKVYESIEELQDLGEYTINQVGRLLTIETAVSIDWITSVERVFPLKIDPALSVSPNNANNWVNTVYSNGNPEVAGTFGRLSGVMIYSFIKYNTTSIPNTATVNLANGYINVDNAQTTGFFTSQWGGRWQFSNGVDPTINSGITLFSSSTTDLSSDQPINNLGLKNRVFSTPAGIQYVQDGVATGFISASVRPTTGYNQFFSNTRYYHFSDHTSSNKPYINIDYTLAVTCTGTPIGGIGTTAPSSGTHGTTYLTSVSGASAVSGLTYQWETAPSATGPWTLVSGATNLTHNFTAPFVNGTLFYRRKITCTSSGLSEYSTVTSFNSICAPAHALGNDYGCIFGGFGCEGYYGITNVSMGTINSTTTYNSTGAPSYTSYPAQSTIVGIGSNYILNVTYSDDDDNLGKIGVWVDWNEDGDFSGTNEFIGIANNINDGDTEIFNITVPTGLALGTKTLRIRSVSQAESLTINDACSNMQYGETEDYYLTIFACANVANLVASIGSPSNGLKHLINLNWDAIPGATGYDLQFSTDGTSYATATPASVTMNSAGMDMGDNPNTQYWFRVRAKNGVLTCNWANVGPIYTAADMPEVPLLNNAFGTIIDLTITAEIPVENPVNTEYSIYCSTEDLFLQSNGALGASEIWQTKSAWGTTTLTGLTLGKEYCFYAKARNQDGHIVGNNSTYISESFDTDIIETGTIPSNNNVWYSTQNGPHAPFNWSASFGCPATGGIGRSATTSVPFRNDLRLPVQDLNGVDKVTMTFDLSNSHTPGQNNHLFRFYIDDGTGIQHVPTSVEIGNIYYTTQGALEYFGFYTMSRNCEKVTVTYDISSISNKSAIFFFIHQKSGHDNNNPFYFEIDNIKLSSVVPTSCATVASSPTPQFYNYHDMGYDNQLAFDNSRMNQDDTLNFRLSHETFNADSYQIEINTSFDFTGTSFLQTFNGTFLGNTEKNYLFSNASGQLNSNNTTYYVRARVRTGATYGNWTSKTYSFTYDGSIPIIEWYQKTSPQFMKDKLDGTTTLNDYVTVSTENPFVDPSFESGIGWTNYNFITGMEFNLSDASGWKSNGNRAASISQSGGIVTEFGETIISQEVDLSNVSEIIFDAQSFYETFTGQTLSGGKIDLIIGNSGTFDDSSGDVVATLNHCADGSGACVLQTLNTIAIIPLALRSSNKILKFVWSDTGNDFMVLSAIGFSIDNIRAKYEDKVGTIYSTPFVLKSIPVLNQQYTEMFWDQEINSSMTLAMQYFNSGTQVWQDVSGYDNFSVAATGPQIGDLTGMPTFDSVRVKAVLTGAEDLRLLSWGLRVFDDAPLPVELTTFAASCNEGETLIEWTTASESNSSHFMLEKSRDGKTWVKVEELKAAGNSTTEVKYSSIDKNSWNGIIYYRLRQFDFDGKQEVFDPISSECITIENNMKVYPNPNNGAFAIEISCNRILSETQLVITDMTGKLLVSKVINIMNGITQILFNEQDFQRGVYLVSLKGSDIDLKPVRVVVQ